MYMLPPLPPPPSPPPKPPPKPLPSPPPSPPPKLFYLVANSASPEVDASTNSTNSLPMYGNTAMILGIAFGIVALLAVVTVLVIVKRRSKVAGFSHLFFLTCMLPLFFNMFFLMVWVLFLILGSTFHGGLGVNLQICQDGFFCQK